MTLFNINWCKLGIHDWVTIIEYILNPQHDVDNWIILKDRVCYKCRKIDLNINESILKLKKYKDKQKLEKNNRTEFANECLKQLVDDGRIKKEFG